MQKGVIKMTLSNVSTAELVRELSEREGVERIMAGPYQSYEIRMGEQSNPGFGPVVILRVWD